MKRDGHAEANFRAAFERLRNHEPLNLPVDALLTQNNVAREAGQDPSALKKARFPDLVNDIQEEIACRQQLGCDVSRLEKVKDEPGKTSLKARIADLQLQRDQMASLLLEANAKILELRTEVQYWKEAKDEEMSFRCTIVPNQGAVNPVELQC